MRIAVLALLGVVLLVGCVDHRVRPAATPTETIEDLRARLRASAIPDFRSTPTPETPTTRRMECEAVAARPESVFTNDRALLMLSPAIPRPGEQVSISGEGLRPGEYEILIGTIWSESPAGRGTVIVGPGGAVSVSVRVPELPTDYCGVVLLRTLLTLEPRYIARPFLVP